MVRARPHAGVGRPRRHPRCAIRSLPHAALKHGSALDIPYDDNSFDYVFSHGVLHHIPDIRRAQSEIHRVLRPGGVLVAMLYAAPLAQLPGQHPRPAARPCWRPRTRSGVRRSSRTTGMLRAHLDNAERIGLTRYLRMETFTHHNTDGPLNPFARVYSPREVERDFPDFRLETTYQRYMHAPPLPVHRLPGESRVGWHLWAHLRARTGDRPLPVEEARADGTDTARRTNGGEG